jgi:predicted nucleotidyltransferase
MQKASVEAIVRSLNENGVRYLIVGGLAVVAHGYVRFTADFDVVLDLEVGNVQRALNVFKALGYVPRVPVPIEQFAEANLRESWVRDKGMVAFSLRSDLHPMTEVDIFAHNPFDFEEVFTRSIEKNVFGNVTARFIGIDDLLQLKRQANRSKDVVDIEKLEQIKERMNHDSA